MDHAQPCRHCGHCPHCGQPMPGVAGPYYPYQPYYPPYNPPVWTQPWQIPPGGIYIGDPPPGQAPISICTTSTTFLN